MVTKEIEAIVNAARELKGKGMPVVETGTTEGGKSTALEACAKDIGVQNVLSVREANGKGSTKEVEIIATDSEAIPVDKVIMLASLKKQGVADCSDDNDFLGNILYSACKDYAKDSNIETYNNKLQKTFLNGLNHPANESLQYKLKDLSDDEYNALLEIIKRFDIGDTMSVFNEMLVKNPKKGQAGVKIFIEIFSSKTSFAELINCFWERVVIIINKELERLKELLEASYALIDITDAGDTSFAAMFGEEDLNSEILNLLLKSEDSSKEYLLSNVSLIFRGADFLFQDDNREHLVVLEREGIKTRCLRIIDTQGLFHATGVKVNEEADRIVDLLSEYHSNKLLLIINSYITDTVKDGYEAIRKMLQDVNRDIEIYIICTHWDEYFKTFSQQAGAAERMGKFTRSKNSVNWQELLPKAVKAQDEVLNTLKESITNNTSRRKPRIIAVYRAAILLDSENRMENILEEAEYEYPKAMMRFVSDMIAEQSKIGSKIRVLDGIDARVSIDITNSSKQDISSLYNNLVGECKGKKLFASTARASKRKWCDAGNVHISNVNDNDYGFKNIETKFVQEIRNYAMSFKNRLVIDADQFILEADDIKKFYDGIMEYITFNQNFGREAAKEIGNEAYKYGFMMKTGFAYQYERFTDMLQYTQDVYFNASSIIPSDVIVRCLSQALRNCIKNYVDEKCIIVY